MSFFKKVKKKINYAVKTHEDPTKIATLGTFGTNPLWVGKNIGIAAGNLWYKHSKAKKLAEVNLAHFKKKTKDPGMAQHMRTVAETNKVIAAIKKGRK